MENENKKKQPTLKQLYAFRDRVKREILGQKDPEYRAELEFVLDRTDQKIREVKASGIPKNPNTK